LSKILLKNFQPVNIIVFFYFKKHTKYYIILLSKEQ